MPVDFTPFFKKYEELLNAANQVFDKVRSDFPECVKCKEGCSDCCHALFDLTLVEALYINHQFNKAYEGRDDEKAALLERANEADRKVYKLKRNAYKELQAGKPEREILEEMAAQRLRCPLLDDEDKCILYEYRPLTCRFYGIPTAIGGQGHTCGISAFKKGEPYPTVNMDTLYQHLYAISEEITAYLNTKYVKMSEMLVPLSMALITVYDDEYLGIAEEKKEGGKEESAGENNDG